VLRTLADRMSALRFDERPLHNGDFFVLRLQTFMTPKRIIIALGASLLCCWGIWQAARVGFARTLGEYAAGQRRDNAARAVASLAAVSDAKGAAHRAVAILPGDAESHFALAEVLQRFENYAPALDEYQRAVALRPRD
jgi:tetratricopeptide (TPR) repeat protein